MRVSLGVGFAANDQMPQGFQTNGASQTLTCPKCHGHHTVTSRQMQTGEIRMCLDCRLIFTVRDTPPTGPSQ